MKVQNTSISTRDTLLQSGLALVALKGLRGLTVRELAAHAQVNLGSFVYHFRNHDAFISHLFADAFAGEVAAQQFLLNLPYRHPQIIYHLLQDAQTENSIVEGSVLHLMIFIMTAVGMPMLLAGEVMQGCTWLPMDAQKIRDLMRDPAAAKQRLAWALIGIQRSSNSRVTKDLYE